MSLHRLSLPIDSDRFNQLDQTLTLAGTNWHDYQNFATEEYSGYLVSYFQGVISIVSPGRNHESIAQTFIVLINAYCRHYGLMYYSLGSTRLENPPLAGKEPDVAYAFNTNKAIPDLAIEVVFSSGSIQELAKYREIGVKEVWFWQNNEIHFYELVEDSYQEISISHFLPQLTPHLLASFVNRGLNESQLTIETDFVEALN